VDRDQGHDRRTGGGELADIGAQISDQARRAYPHLCVGQIQFGFRQCGGGAAQMGVVFLVATFLLLCPLDFSNGCAQQQKLALP
jgi:hypothetical protein